MYNNVHELAWALLSQLCCWLLAGAIAGIAVALVCAVALSAYIVKRTLGAKRRRELAERESAKLGYEAHHIDQVSMMYIISTWYINFLWLSKILLALTGLLYPLNISVCNVRALCTLLFHTMML
jgi:hypothetical protein